MNLERRILNRLNSGEPNVLLFGPPGTGKTHAMGRLYSRLSTLGADDEPENLEPGTRFNPMRLDGPFLTRSPEQGEGEEAGPFQEEVKTAWMTFHQSTGYEDFILGLRPRPENGGVRLTPRAGTLLSLAEHARSGGTSVLFIDEINRANVSRVFGQFISVMESDKRLDSDGNRTDTSLGLTLPQVQDGETIENPLGDDFDIEIPFFFPHDVYLVAAMNSLDRSTQPLDSALSRRFDHVPCRPDYEVLGNHLDTDFLAGSPLPDSPEDTSPPELGMGLLYRINQFMWSALGEDFQLGHGYLWSVGDAPMEDQLAELVFVWEEKILPKLIELFRSREDQLASFFKLDQDTPDDYPYSRRQIEGRWEDLGLNRPLDLPSIQALDPEVQRLTLHTVATPTSD